MNVNKKKPKAIFFCPFPHAESGFTGATIATLNTYNLIKDDIDIDIMDTSIKSFDKEGFSFGKLKHNFVFLLHMIGMVRKLNQKVKKEKYDILYFVGASRLKGNFRDMATVWATYKYVPSIVIHNHNGDFHIIFERGWLKRWVNKFVSRVDKFIFLAPSLKANVKSYLPEEKCFVLSNLIDKKLLCSDQEVQTKFQAKTKETTTQKTFLYLSNMIPSKGYFDILEAMKILNEQGEDFCHVEFIGRWYTEKDREVFENYARQHNLSNRIKIWGKQTDREWIRQKILEVDALILPTYYPIEAQPLVIIEAMNAGNPIISTRHASIPEMIEDGKEGFLVDKKSPRQIAEAMLKMKNTSDWISLAENARKRFVNQFSKTPIQKRVREIMLDNDEYTPNETIASEPITQLPK